MTGASQQHTKAQHYKSKTHKNKQKESSFALWADF